MLQGKNLSKYYGSQTLFSDISFSIESNERVGLIGRNGSGKTTLLKILLEEESADVGQIIIPPEYTVSALSQHLSFRFPTLLSEVCSVLHSSEEDTTWKAKSILMGLGFLESDFDKSPEVFSGGYKVRIRLAQALLKEPDLLLLDEPTNYLDILSIRWLEGFLKSWKKSFLLITHDVSFMEKVVETTIALHRGKLRKIKGGPLKLMDNIKKDEEIYEKTRQNQEKKQAAQEEFIRTFRAGARSAGLVQSRIKALEKQEIGEKLQELPKIQFRFKGEEFRGKIMIEAEKISAQYEKGFPLFSDFSISLHSYNKTAIIGQNGKGKTTLLNILAGKKNPNSGTIKIAPTCKIGYLGSESFQSLSAEKSLLEEVVSTGVNEQEARKILGQLLFSGESVKKKIKYLSGGEKNRACMAKILVSSNHILILDEPTNHLDLESCLALSKALKEFEGAILMVSHDERMLSEISKNVIVFQNDTITKIEENYETFLSQIGWQEEEKGKEENKISDNKKQYLEQKEHQKRMRQLLTKAEKKEETIKKQEEDMKKLTDIFSKSSSKKDYEKIKETGIKIKNLQSTIDENYKILESIIDEIE